MTPPGGWCYRVTETGKRFSGHPSPESLRTALAQHCSLHNLPVPTDDMIQDSMCRELGPESVNWCVDSDSGQAQLAYLSAGAAPCRLSFMSVLNATRTIGSWLLKGRNRVEGAEAERRARICSSCPENRSIDGCSSCSMPALKSALELIIGGAATTVDGMLQGCCICGCSLRGLVWMPLETLHERMPASENDRLPSHCWKKRVPV